MCELQDLFDQFEEGLRSGKMSPKVVRAEVGDRIAVLMQDYPEIFLNIEDTLGGLTWAEYSSKQKGATEGRKEAYIKVLQDIDKEKVFKAYTATSQKLRRKGYKKSMKKIDIPQELWDAYDYVNTKTNYSVFKEYNRAKSFMREYDKKAQN